MNKLIGIIGCDEYSFSIKEKCSFGEWQRTVIALKGKEPIIKYVYELDKNAHLWPGTNSFKRRIYPELSKGYMHSSTDIRGFEPDDTNIKLEVRIAVPNVHTLIGLNRKYGKLNKVFRKWLHKEWSETNDN